MKIGIDARMIDHSGIGTYLKTLVSHVAEFDKNEYVLFGDPLRLDRFGLKTIEAKFPIYSVAEQFRFPAIIKSSRVNLFHAPHYNVPFFYNGKIVTTIHDLIHVIFPEFLPSKSAYFYAKFMINSACKRSRVIITDSQNTKNDIIKHFNVEASKIKVINIGANPVFQPSSQKGLAVQKNIGRYILYVGAIRPHKNLHTLVEAFKILKKKDKIEHKLVLIGNGKPDYVSKIDKMISEYGIAGSVLKLEVKSQEELQQYYCGADVFVFPSLYEGFGLPPLEAMACGCPVVTSNSSSLPEVVGEAGIMVDAGSIEELSSAIYKVISNEDVRNSMSRSGLSRSKIFSYEETVKETVKIYNEVLS